MDFRNKDNIFDFSELPSASGAYGSYGTNHLKEDYHIDAAKGMTYILEDIENFKNDFDIMFSDCTESEEKLKKEFAEKLIDELLYRLAGTVADTVVAFGDDESCNEEN